MSVTKRFISGSAASWVRIAVTMVSQLLLVPVYLTYWDITTYGIWIAIQSLISILNTLDLGHQTFLEYKFLSIGTDNKTEIALNLWSSIVISLAIGVAEILIVLFLIFYGNLENLIGTLPVNSNLLKDTKILLLLQILVWVVTGCLGGIFTRVLTPFGYFARMNWWGVWAATITSLAPIVAIIFGAKLLTAGIALAASIVIFNIPVYFDAFRIMKKEGILYKTYSMKLGLRNLFSSLALTGKSLLESARQQGVRLMLAPLAGAPNLVAFSTMRTGANVALQGLNTITNPIMPELMHFLNKRDQDRTVASFGTIWFVVIAAIAPGTVILQAFIEPVFEIWTKGRVLFDPLLFAFLSLGVLVYALAQPAMAIVKGNNLLGPQLAISIIAALIVVGGMFLLVPQYGIIGAGGALLLSEIVSNICYEIFAKNWLKANSLKWPKKSYLLTIISIVISSLVMLLMIYCKPFKWLILPAGLICLAYNFNLFYQSLPLVITSKIKLYVVNLRLKIN